MNAWNLIDPEEPDSMPPVNQLVLVATKANHVAGVRVESGACYWNGAVWCNAGGMMLPSWGAVIAWQQLPPPPVLQ